MATISFDFAGRTVLVTGGARGIGLELSRFFADCGADVAMVDWDADELATAAGQVGALAFPADVSSTEQVDDAVARTVDEFGRVDVLINNAGILRDGVVWKMTDEDWTSVLAVHAGGAFRFTRAYGPLRRADRDVHRCRLPRLRRGRLRDRCGPSGGRRNLHLT